MNSATAKWAGHLIECRRLGWRHTKSWRRGVHGRALSDGGSSFVAQIIVNSVIYMTESSLYTATPAQAPCLSPSTPRWASSSLVYSFVPRFPGRSLSAHFVFSLPCTLASTQLPSQPVDQKVGLERRASNFQRHDLPSAPQLACYLQQPLSTRDPCKTESLSLRFLLPCLPPADGVIRAVSHLPCSLSCDRNRLPTETTSRLPRTRYALAPRSTSIANAATANTNKTKTTT